jgi:hypothetical protein
MLVLRKIIVVQIMKMSLLMVEISMDFSSMCIKISSLGKY